MTDRPYKPYWDRDAREWTADNYGGSAEEAAWRSRHNRRNVRDDDHPGMLFNTESYPGGWEKRYNFSKYVGEFPWMDFLTPGGRIVSAECIATRFPVAEYADCPAMAYSGLKMLAECIRERIDNGFDCLILVTGDRGAGKSTLILQTALELNPNISVNSIAFRIEEFSEIFARNKPGGPGHYPQIILDEAGFSMHAQDWMNRAQRTITKHMIVSRIKRQIIWMAVPKRSQLNNQLRDMPYLWVHVKEPIDFLQGYAEVLTAPGPVQSKWHAERYWLHQFVFIFRKLEGALWDEYEKRKIDFVQEVSGGQGPQSLSDDLDESIHKMSKDGMTQRAIASRLGIAQSTVSKRSVRK